MDKWYNRQLWKDLCISCTEPALPGKVRCKAHHENNLAKARARRKRIRDAKKQCNS